MGIDLEVVGFEDTRLSMASILGTQLMVDHIEATHLELVHTA